MEEQEYGYYEAIEEPYELSPIYVEEELSEDEISEATAEVVWRNLLKTYNNNFFDIGEYLQKISNAANDTEINTTLTRICTNECDYTRNSRTLASKYKHGCADYSNASYCNGEVSLNNLLVYYDKNLRLHPPPSIDAKIATSQFILDAMKNMGESFDVFNDIIDEADIHETESASQLCAIACKAGAKTKGYKKVCDPILRECTINLSIGELKSIRDKDKRRPITMREIASKSDYYGDTEKEMKKLQALFPTSDVSPQLPFAYDQHGKFDTKILSALMIMKNYGKKSFPNHWTDPSGFQRACERACKNYDGDLSFLTEYDNACTITKGDRYIHAPEFCKEIPRKVELDSYLCHDYAESCDHTEKIAKCKTKKCTFI